MSRRSVLPSESAAGVLALMVAANGRVDVREMRALEELDAFSRIGVRRERFVELAQGCLDDIGSSLCECSWLRAPALDYIDAMLDRVDEPRQRLLLCRLAAAVITADGVVSVDERMVYGHVLARWRISQSMVTRAILHDRPH